MDGAVLVMVGMVLIILGINNTKGNISSLHSYHRKRVREEDRIPFGKLVGTGTILIGIATILYGALSFLAQMLSQEILAGVGEMILIAGLVVGLGISFYGMIKYNKGIF